MQVQATLQKYDDSDLSAEADKVLFEDINFTQSQLRKAVEEAIVFHQSLADTVLVTPEYGMQTALKKAPDWAASLLRKKGVIDSVVEKMGSWSFVKRRAEDSSLHTQYIQRCFDNKEPVIFRIAFGPVKNINLPMCRQLPDFGEYLTFVQLSRLASALSTLYPYGIKIQVVPDNIRAQIANLCPVSHVRSYINGLIKLAEGLGFDQWLLVETDQSRLYELYNTKNYLDQADAELQDWKNKDPEAFDYKWQSACYNAQKNIPQTPDDNTAEVEGAAWRYLVAHRAEIISGMWSPQDVFPLVYANHPNTYQLYSLFQKNTKLPWQNALPTSLLPDISIPGLQ